jgi:thioredoxin-like negative regulator of GroEL
MSVLASAVLMAAGGDDLKELHARANAGDEEAALQLADVLAKRGDLDSAAQILRARADAGDRNAAEQLAGQLASQLTRRGQGEEAERLRRFGLNPDGSIACA